MSAKMAIPVIPPLVALGLRPLPLMPLQPVLAGVIQTVLKSHPDIFDRLGEHASKTFGLDPTDLPFAFILEPSPDAPRARAVRALPEHLDVRISGPIAALIGLLDGSYDGDALFFSRDLVIEGDMEATLALRNAVDDAQIDLAGEIAARLGPLAPQAEKAIRRLMETFEPARRREEPQWN